MNIEISGKIYIEGRGDLLLGKVLSPSINSNKKVGQLVGQEVEFKGAKYRITDVEYFSGGDGRVNPKQNFGFLVRGIL